MENLESVLRLHGKLRTINKKTPTVFSPVLTKIENVRALYRELADRVIDPSIPGDEDCFLVYSEHINHDNLINRFEGKRVCYYEIGKSSGNQEAMTFYSVPSTIETARKLFGSVAEEFIDPKAPNDGNCIIVHLKEDLRDVIKVRRGFSNNPIFYHSIFPSDRETILEYNKG